VAASLANPRSNARANPRMRQPWHRGRELDAAANLRASSAAGRDRKPIAACTAASFNRSYPDEAASLPAGVLRADARLHPDRILFVGHAMPEPVQLVIGGEEHERLAVQVLGRERSGAFGADDGNWIDARVSVAAGAFRGEVACSLRAEDFAAFLAQVRLLEVQPSGTARFSTMEDQLEFAIAGDGLGRFDVRGHLMDAAGIGNRLAWSLAIDQTHLPRIIAALSDISTRYGARGRRMSN